ncbi:hypothetical protein AWJ20_4587 [Sugiyamaella lignohabitans]|uniref:Uncharacterized protein n=1 Tax=Sugiyamaella lignohabitans TaxID=796027 RepID=A0A167CJ40_9ASCO|nr:uncharacterized protein AWJ20_4587 [Sugiyamaella lignohabitans]ANB11765.1 hypothetical protein AWJ20_4587 [Sugiyamaella lignohabitans]
MPRLSNYDHQRMGELAFQNFGEKRSSSSVRAYENISFWDEMVELARIFGNIQDLNRELVMGKLLQYDDLINRVTDLSSQLESWYTSLPEHIKFSEENLDRFRGVGVARTFLALHIGYHHYGSILYFQFLDETQSPTEVRKHFSSLCAYHAFSLSRLIMLSSHPKRECMPLYNAVGHCVVVSSSVLLHKLLFGEVEEIPTTRDHLESNFAALILLRKYWSNIDTMINRLQVFQNACKLSSDKAFQLDNRMLRFLLQYSMSVEEKTDVDTFIEQSNKIDRHIGIGDSLMASLLESQQSN